jgi:hypothetical protein
MLAPLLDLAPITRHMRAKASSHLLVVAVHHIPVFEVLSKGACSLNELQQKLQLRARPAMVLFPALSAMGLLKWKENDVLQLTELGTYLTTACPSNLIGYAALEKEDPGVLRMAQWLLNDGPEIKTQGLSYVKDESAPSPMDEPEPATFFTMALAGRARYLAPVVAAKIPKRQGHLLDVAGGTGYYTYEWLLANPGATATILDRPEVLKVAQSLLEEFCKNDPTGMGDLKSRVRFLPGDMLQDQLPMADILFAFSLFHDWADDTCMLLAQRFADALQRGGELWIHDAFLHDNLDGPLAVTDYSAQLFLNTKGRAYSAKEYSNWLSSAGLVPSGTTTPTLLDYGLLHARKP